jgi:hypothetical protein
VLHKSLAPLADGGIPPAQATGNLAVAFPSADHNTNLARETKKQKRREIRSKTAVTAAIVVAALWRLAAVGASALIAAIIRR